MARTARVIDNLWPRGIIIDCTGHQEAHNESIYYYDPMPLRITKTSFRRTAILLVLLGLLHLLHLAEVLEVTERELVIVTNLCKILQVACDAFL